MAFKLASRFGAVCAPSRAAAPVDVMAKRRTGFAGPSVRAKTLARIVAVRRAGVAMRGSTVLAEPHDRLTWETGGGVPAGRLSSFAPWT